MGHTQALSALVYSNPSYGSPGSSYSGSSNSGHSHSNIVNQVVAPVRPAAHPAGQVVASHNSALYGVNGEHVASAPKPAWLHGRENWGNSAGSTPSIVQGISQINALPQTWVPYTYNGQTYIANEDRLQQLKQDYATAMRNNDFAWMQALAAEGQALREAIQQPNFEPSRLDAPGTQYQTVQYQTPDGRIYNYVTEMPSQTVNMQPQIQQGHPHPQAVPVNNTQNIPLNNPQAVTQGLQNAAVALGYSQTQSGQVLAMPTNVQVTQQTVPVFDPRTGQTVQGIIGTDGKTYVLTNSGQYARPGEGTIVTVGNQQYMVNNDTGVLLNAQGRPDMGWLATNAPNMQNSDATVQVQLPNGQTVNGYSINGRTFLEDGSRVPVGAIVTADNGAMWEAVTATPQDPGLSNVSGREYVMEESYDYTGQQSQVAPAPAELTSQVPQTEEDIWEMLDAVLGERPDLEKNPYVNYAVTPFSTADITDTFSGMDTGALTWDDAIAMATELMTPYFQTDMTALTRQLNETEQRIPYILAGRGLDNGGFVESAEQEYNIDKTLAIDQLMVERTAKILQLAKDMWDSDQTRSLEEKKVAMEQYLKELDINNAKQLAMLDYTVQQQQLDLRYKEWFYNAWANGLLPDGGQTEAYLNGATQNIYGNNTYYNDQFTNYGSDFIGSTLNSYNSALSRAQGRSSDRAGAGAGGSDLTNLRRSVNYYARG